MRQQMRRLLLVVFLCVPAIPVPAEVEAYYCRINSGEPWEAVAKVGPHADVTVQLGELDATLVFWRGSSYLPYWQAAGGTWHFDEVIPRKGNGIGAMPDRTNQYAHVRIVENTAARARVVWRYVPNFDNPGLQGWAEEEFTVYPDGLCVRAIRKGTQSLAEWLEPTNTQIRKTLLSSDGVNPLPHSWKSSAGVLLDASCASHYRDLGYSNTRGCHVLECAENGQPFTLRCTFDAREGAPVRNPALVVKNWGDADVDVTVNGNPFQKYEADYAKHMNGADLIVWLNIESPDPVRVSISPEGGSGPIARAPIADPYSHDPWVFPEGSSDPGPFGAYYTHLKYSKGWDEPWRVGESADIVVLFDQSADRLIFWRGTGYVPHWANQQGFWYNDEFCERRGEDSGLDGLCEPMQDHECRYANVRIIQSHNARAIVHWRYQLCNSKYQRPFVDETGWGDTVDAYYTVYPDEVAVRKVTLYTSAPHEFNEWHEAIPLVKPGTIPEDNLYMEAVAMTDIKGNSHLYSWENGFPKKWYDDLNIMLVRMKGGAMPFVVVESRGVWVDEVSMPDDTRFNHYDDWPGWPESKRRSDWERDETGYREFWKILPSHSSLMHYMWDDYANDLEGLPKWKCKIMLSGMTTIDDVNALIPLAKSWEQPPALKVESSGFTGGYYDKTERVYRISRRSKDAKTLKLTLNGSADSPIVNPCFVIENWPRDSAASVAINGRTISPGPDFRQGIEKTADGIASLVMWIKKGSIAPLTLSISTN